MKPLMVLTLGFVFALPAIAERSPRTIEPTFVDGARLSYRQDGDDLVVSTTVIVFDAPYAVLTADEHAEPYRSILRFTVIQNADHRLRGRRAVDIEWRLKGVRRRDAWPIRVKGLVLLLDGEELKPLDGANPGLTRDA